MTQDIRIPDIGDAEEVEVVEVIAAAGDSVGEDDPIIVIESDKASMEVPAGVAGTIAEITVSVGDSVSEGQVIARLESSAGADAADEPAAQPAEESADETSDEASAKTSDKRSDEKSDEKSVETSDETSGKRSGGGTRTVEVKVPDIGDAEGVEVIEVAVKPGDTVAENDVLVVVESDKASMEIPSSHAGTVKEVHVEVGSGVAEGTLLVTLEARASTQSSNTDQRAAPAPARPSVSDESASPRAEADASPPPSGQAKSAGRPAEPEAPPSSGTEVYAGPAVRRLARELGVDLKAVKGSGNRGRIVKDDVKAHVKSRMAGASTPAPTTGLPTMPAVDFSKYGEIEEQPLSRVRARGAENLHRAWVNVPHVTQHDEVDVTDLEEFRGRLKAEGERRGIKVTPVAFIIKACCQVLREFPTFNASLDPAAKTFILKRYYHIGMAVDTPDGLVVPVIRDADRKGIWELSAEVAELADKARNKKLSPNDMQGGSFSVSSLGAIGGTGFTPIINAPEVAILGVGALRTRPVWQDGGVVPRKLLPLSLSYDHRAINGAEAGRFVARLGEILGDIRHLAL